MLWAVALVFLVGGASARADEAAVKRVQQMNKRAMEDYDNLEFDAARKTLTEALALVRSAGLEDEGHPVAAKTYLNLGIVYVGGFKDRDRGKMQFVRALRIMSNLRLDPSVATPELQEVFNEALREAAKGKTATGKPDDKGKGSDKGEGPGKGAREGADKGRGPAKGEEGSKKPGRQSVNPDEIEPSGEKVEGVFHEPLVESPAGMPVLVKAEVAQELGATKVLLFYRGPGSEDYVVIPLAKNKKGVYVGTIPADQVKGRVIQYYIEARDARGKPLAASGSWGSPHIMSIIPATGEGRVVDDGEDPLRRGEAGALTRRKEEEAPPAPRKPTRLWVFVGAGAGVGLATGHSECKWDAGPQPDGLNYSGFCVVGGSVAETGDYTNISTGFAPAPLHIAPEIGYRIGSRFALSVEGRFQVLTLADPGAATAAPAGVLRGIYFFGGQRFHPYLAFAVGGGIIRHTVPLGKVATKADAPEIRNRNIKDTVLGGWFLFGPGVGFMYDFSRNLALVMEVNLWAGVPHYTFNVDLNIGPAVKF